MIFYEVDSVFKQSSNVLLRYRNVSVGLYLFVVDFLQSFS